MEEKNYSKGIFYILLFASIILSTVILKITSSFFIPLTIALLLSFVFYPFVKNLTKFHIPWSVGIIIIVILAAAIFFAIGNLIVTSCRTILNAYPKYEARFSTVYSMIAEAFHIPFDENSSLIVNLWNSLGVRTFLQNLAFTASNYMLYTLKVIFVIALFIVFFLIEIRGMKEKVKTAFPEEHLSRKIMFMITKTIAEVTRYISIKFLVSFFTGLLVFIFCFAIGLDFAIIWGFLAFLLNFIPTFGSILSWALTTGFAVLQFYPSLGKILYVGIAVLAVNFILGNIIEPRWEGSDLGISPFIILVTLSLWGWLWGFIGMILAVPILVILKIICENIGFLNSIGILLGNKTKFKNKKNPFGFLKGK
ncbi:AI-2E family transporter [Treponema sp.]|uniref:AI-2E family transporter n=1 Tax=Treponema sp. TaxID=166 RepID=UPI003F0FCA80